ncbi:HpcH/HpaI aldolase/citrate lyase family protein [Lysinibacter cavernae]|uniref:Citrate lyase subunit beta/citryl-CoA lyase n=1 Tax=Lysinibacter cavernae TaxID=1640652 RepID=A0A7X5R2P3_9MICO|nr:CoA ester lyase [Lysinibacter cavernae]NIH54461.1 citrate lyase subunit beta/citryl-CoA lyase [Lysinibacter cavernae]
MTSARLVLTGLYVPGDRPDRFEKAVATGADLIILDLEDAVAPANKAEARAAVVRWLTARSDASLSSGPVFQVRLNSPIADDLVALSGLDSRIEFRIPKVESAEDLDAVRAQNPDRQVTALLETALGIERAFEIAQHPSVTRLGIGESDLASELGSRSDAVIGYARNRVLFASVAAGLLPPMLSAFPAINDLAGLRQDTQSGRDDGWVGRVAIHPSQLPVIAEVFVSSAAEVAWANEVLAATADGGVSTLSNGDMVDPAMLGRAKRILAGRPH